MTPPTPLYLQQGICFTLSVLGPLRGPHCLGAEAGIPPPVSGLHSGTMGKDKPWETRPPRERDRIMQGNVDTPHTCQSTLLGRLCACMDTGQFDFINDKETQQANEKIKMKGLDEVTWWGGWDHFKWDYTEGERAQTLSLTLLNLHTTEQDIAAPSTIFTVWSQVYCVNKSPSTSCLRVNAALRQRMHWHDLEYSSVIVFKCLVLAFAPHVPTSLENNTAVFSLERWIIHFRWLEVRWLEM